MYTRRGQRMYSIVQVLPLRLHILVICPERVRFITSLVIDTLGRIQGILCQPVTFQHSSVVARNEDLKTDSSSIMTEIWMIEIKYNVST